MCVANLHYALPVYKVTYLLDLSVMLKSQYLWRFQSYYPQIILSVQNGEKWSFVAHAFPAGVKQGSDLLSCVAFHVVNKCTFYDVCHILKYLCFSFGYVTV